MVIRPARLSDIPRMVEVSREFYEEMQFDGLGWHFDPATVKQSYTDGIEHPDRFLLLVTDDLSGIFFAAIQNRSLYFSGHRYAQEIVWHSRPCLGTQARGKIMIGLYREAKKALGNIPLYLSSDMRLDSVGQWLKKQGAVEMSRYWYSG